VQGVPSDPGAMLAFVMEARSHMKTNSGPHVVHCSPGTGRTGTVIACDMAIRDFELTRTVDVPKTVYAVRRCRAGAVQTRDQYALIYKVYLVMKLLTAIYLTYVCTMTLDHTVDLIAHLTCPSNGGAPDIDTL